MKENRVHKDTDFIIVFIWSLPANLLMFSYLTNCNPSTKSVKVEADVKPQNQTATKRK